MIELSKEFKERFVKKLQGKEFVLYGGLLELVRQRGLKSITTHIVQLPTAENGNYAVVTAEVVTDDGIFTEVGDACPGNVNRTIQPHVLRMAATRAKARAMRDAVGIDMVALEELGDLDDMISDDKPVNNKSANSNGSPKAQQSKAQPAAENGGEQCSECGTGPLHPNVVDFSKRVYGKALCMDCQRKAKKLDAKS